MHIFSFFFIINFFWFVCFFNQNHWVEILTFIFMPMVDTSEFAKSKSVRHKLSCFKVLSTKGIRCYRSSSRNHNCLYTDDILNCFRHFLFSVGQYRTLHVFSKVKTRNTLWTMNICLSIMLILRLLTKWKSYLPVALVGTSGDCQSK